MLLCSAFGKSPLGPFELVHQGFEVLSDFTNQDSVEVAAFVFELMKSCLAFADREMCELTIWPAMNSEQMVKWVESPEYELVAHSWISEQVNDGLYLICKTTCMLCSRRRSAPLPECWAPPGSATPPLQCWPAWSQVVEALQAAVAAAPCVVMDTMKAAGVDIKMHFHKRLDFISSMGTHIP